MLFQVIDEKDGCYGIYTKGGFIYDRVPDALRGTWDWSSHLSGDDYDYAHVWSGGKSLDEVCPEHLKKRFEIYQNRIKANLKAHLNAKIDVSDMCLFDMVPESQIRDFLEIKNQICKYVFDVVPKPANYLFLSRSHEMCKEIAKQNLKS